MSEELIQKYAHGLMPPVALRPKVTGSELEFPARYFSIDPEEENITARHTYVKQLALAHGQKGASVIYDPDLINDQIMMMMHDEEENVRFAFHEFVVPFYKPSTSPSGAMALNQVLPEYREMRMKTIEMKWDLLEMISSWSIKSRLSREDILFLYALVQLDSVERDDFINWLTTDSVPYPKGVAKWTDKERALKKIIENSIARYKQFPILGDTKNTSANTIGTTDLRHKRAFERGSNSLGPRALRLGGDRDIAEQIDKK